MSNRQLLVTEDGSHTFFLPELNETYHSSHGAIQESDYVFIHQGLDFLAKKNQFRSLSILEVGFGTGLNALISAIYAEKHGISIHYEGLEAFPLEASEIGGLNYAELLKGPMPKKIFPRIHQSPWSEQTEILSTFTLKKIEVKIQDYQANRLFDLCYFDAFAPNKQPEMWTSIILEKIWNLLLPRGVFVTYSAKGQLKRDLKGIGFEVETLPGPPGKMQMVRGIKI